MHRCDVKQHGDNQGKQKYNNFFCDDRRATADTKPISQIFQNNQKINQSPPKNNIPSMTNTSKQQEAVFLIKPRQNLNAGMKILLLAIQLNQSHLIT